MTSAIYEKNRKVDNHFNFLIGRTFPKDVNKFKIFVFTLTRGLMQLYNQNLTTPHSRYFVPHLTLQGGLANLQLMNNL